MKHRIFEDTMSENIRILENISQISETLKRLEQDMKTGFKSVNDRMWSNFLWLLSMTVGSTVGLAYLMAHGFHWF